MRSNIPLVIRSTVSDYKGTLITNYDRSRSFREDTDKIVTSVAYIDNRTQAKILPNQMEYEDFEIIFNRIAEAGISIDMINIYPNQIYFIIDEKQTEVLEEVLKELDCKYEIVHNCTKVTIIGNRMRGIPGVMAKAVSALSKENIEILQTSDSHTTISCLIDSKYTSKAVNALHNYFQLGD